MMYRASAFAHGSALLLRAAFALAALSAAAPARAADEPAIVYEPLSIAGLAEFGVLQSGRYSNNPRFRDEWVDHLGVFVTQSARLGERAAVSIGLGGIFQYQKKEVVLAQWGGTQYRSFFVGPSVADFRWGSTAAETEDGFGFQFGRFAYKYNPDAVNLGEYLFRSGPYPTYIFGGGYTLIGNTRAHLQGALGRWRRGGFQADVLLTTETTLPALYDFSAAGVAAWRSGGGALELGAGVNFKNLVPVRPSRTSSPSRANTYFVKDGRAYTGYNAYYGEQIRFYEAMAGKDPANADAWRARAAAVVADTVAVDAWLRDPAAAGIEVKHYTQAGTLLMARASLDPKPFLPEGLAARLGSNDLRLSAEAALLGVKNYPVFYENRLDRVPVTVGLNLPGFRLLDLVSLQLERFASPWMNTYTNLVSANLPLPTVPGGTDVDRSEAAYNDIARRDDWSWSVLLRKNLAWNAWAAAQFARDHSRVVSEETWAGPGLEPTEVLGRNDDWYWTVQVGFGI